MKTPFKIKKVEASKLRDIKKELFPEYAYQIQEHEVPAEAAAIYEELLEFIVENSELIDESFSEDFKAGFRKALAIARLWIDSTSIDVTIE